MNKRAMGFGLALAFSSLAAWSADGLVPPAADTLWPHWQARIAVQTAPSPLNAGRLLADGSAPRSVQGGAVLGDYYFATPSFGSFRASGGLMVGSSGSLPMGNGGGQGPRLGVAVSSGAAPGPSPAAAGEGPGTVPYLGLGFTGASARIGLAVSADLGLAAAGNVGRAVFGNQGFDSTLRELRLSPVLQLGVRYTF